jgi:hypothetical protein
MIGLNERVSRVMGSVIVLHRHFHYASHLYGFGKFSSLQLKWLQVVFAHVTP